MKADPSSWQLGDVVWTQTARQTPNAPAAAQTTASLPRRQKAKTIVKKLLRTFLSVQVFPKHSAYRKHLKKRLKKLLEMTVD